MIAPRNGYCLFTRLAIPRKVCERTRAKQMIYAEQFETQVQQSGR